MQAPTDYNMMARDSKTGVAIYLTHPVCACQPFVLSVFIEDIELRKEEFFCVNTDEATDRFIDTLRDFRQAGIVKGLATYVVAKGII